MAVEIRQARPDERDALLSVANTSFSRPDRAFDFASLLPYCFIEQRIGDHWLYLQDGKILGLVGSYPLTVRMNGVDFRTAGVGQVSTLPEARGAGVMSGLLKAVTAEMDQRYDFTWLWGDRRRYGRYGWAWGGERDVYETHDKYLPQPAPEAEVRPLDAEGDFARVYAAAMRLPYTVHFNETEFRLLLTCKEVAGLAWRDAWVLTRPAGRVMLADGPAEQVAGLLAHIVARSKAADPNQWKAAIETGPFDSVLTHVARDHYWSFSRPGSAMFRVCDLAGHLGRVAQAVGDLPGGNGELSFHNTDNGQEVHLLCRDGHLDVAPKAGPDVHARTTAELSEILFGPLPLETLLPGLPAGSPLRAVLRMPAHVSHLFSL